MNAKFQAKLKNIDQFKNVLQLIWNQLAQDSINKTRLSFPQRRLVWWTL